MSIKRNMASLLLMQVLTWGASFLFLVVAPDRVGATDWGALGYAAAYVGLFQLFAGLGTGVLIAREIARDPSKIAQYTYNAALMKIALSVVMLPLGVWIAWALGNGSTTLWLVSIGFVSTALALVTEVAFGALTGLEIIARPAMLQTIQAYVANILGVTVLVLGYGVIAYSAVATFAAAIVCTFSWLMLKPHIRGPRHFDRSTLRFLVVAGAPLMALTVLTTIYGTIDIPILSALTDKATVGSYTLAYRWVGIPVFISTAVAGAYFPRIAANGRPMTDEFPRLVNQAIRITLLASVPCAIGIALLANDYISAIYKPEFWPSIALIQILSFHIPIAALDTILVISLIASNRQNRFLAVAIVAAILNPIVCIPVIRWATHRYSNGAVGASLVTVFTEIIITVGAVLLRAPGVLNRTAVVECIRVIAAGLVMVPVLLKSSSLPLPAQVVLGAAIYGVALVATQAVRLEELSRLRTAVYSRLRGSG